MFTFSLIGISLVCVSVLVFTSVASTKNDGLHTIAFAPHTVPYVTLLVSSGKFTSGLDFSGGRFFSFRGALLFTQGGTFWALKKAQQNSGGLKPL